jgi:hypothetical protein
VIIIMIIIVIIIITITTTSILSGIRPCGFLKARCPANWLLAKKWLV